MTLIGDFYQIGIVVRDIEEGMRKYGRLLGLGNDSDVEAGRRLRRFCFRSYTEGLRLFRVELRRCKLHSRIAGVGCYRRPGIYY